MVQHFYLRLSLSSGWLHGSCLVSETFLRRKKKTTAAVTRGRSEGTWVCERRRRRGRRPSFLSAAAANHSRRNTTVVEFHTPFPKLLGQLDPTPPLLPSPAARNRHFIGQLQSHRSSWLTLDHLGSSCNTRQKHALFWGAPALSCCCCSREFSYPCLPPASSPLTWTTLLTSIRPVLLTNCFHHHHHHSSLAHDSRFQRS